MKAPSGLFGIARQPCRGRRCHLAWCSCKKAGTASTVASGLTWSLLPLYCDAPSHLPHLSGSPPTSAAVANLNFIYILMGTFGVRNCLDLQETHNEFEIPLSMLLSLWAELPLKIRLPPKAGFLTSIQINCRLAFTKETSTFCSDIIV